LQEQTIIAREALRVCVQIAAVNSPGFRRLQRKNHFL
jgi:hypothetical protein